MALAVLFFERVASRKKLKYYESIVGIVLFSLIYVVYSYIFELNGLINLQRVDISLIAIDRWILGSDLFIFSNSYTSIWLTEILQVSYFLFFFLMLWQGLYLIFTRKVDKLVEFTRIIIFGFYFSYIGYVFFPAIGPRFTLLDFSSIDTLLPGLLLTDTIREIINGAANITAVSKAHLDVNEDCIPSGHTMLTLINVYFAFLNRIPIRWPLAIISSLIIVSTMYMHYHYLIDVILGVICAIIALIIEPKIANRLKKVA
ncbi:MAG: phosphatase PAP2 family protein [Candidatus Kapaibacteriales bacterium]